MKAAAAEVAAEVALGLALLSGAAFNATLAAAGVLFLAFALVLLRIRGLKGAAGCGCLGRVLDVPADTPGIVVNVILGVAALGLSTMMHEAHAFTLGERAVLLATGGIVAGVYWLSSYARTVLRMLADYLEGVSTQ